VGQLVEADIGLAALTDYNHIDADWYGRLSERAEDQGIALLPGAELSLAHGRGRIHVLLVANPGISPAQLNQAIASIDKGTQPFIAGRVHRDLDLRCGVAEAAAALRAALPGALLIPAHPSADMGFLSALAPGKALEFLEDIGADAIEHLRPEQASKLRSVDHARAGFYTARCLEFSDAHAVEEIATRLLSDGTPRATWLKLSERTATAVGTALQDPVTRLRTGARPTAPSHLHLGRLRVEGVGFLGELDVELSPHLTAVIGGRGVGKSALLHLIRYALDLPGYRDADDDGLVRHALGSGGKVTMDIRLPGDPGRSYEVSRILDEPPIVRGPDGALIDLTPADVFGDRAEPIVLAQRDLQFIAQEQHARRRLVDELVGTRARASEVRTRSTVAELRTNAAALEAVDARLGGRDDLDQELAQVRHRLALLEEHGGAAQLAEHRTLRERHAGIVRSRDLAQELERDVAASTQASRETLDLLRSGWPGTSDAALGEVSTAVEEAATRLENAFGAVVEATAAVREATGLGAALSEARLSDSADALAELKRQLATDDLDADVLLALDSQRTALLAQRTEQDRVAAQREQLLGDRRGLLTRLRSSRREAFQLRLEESAKVARRLSGTVEIEIVDRGDKEGFRGHLTRFLKSSGISGTAIDRLVADHLDGQALVATMDSSGGLCISDAMAEKLSSWLAEDPRRHELELYVPEDRVEIRLVVDGQPRPLERLSLGQRATALLLLLFATDQRPLVLDQPEDDLDNRFVYDDVVPLLRGAKGGDGDVLERQVVTATHNANIPVLGDAEQILVLDVADHRGRVDCDGSIDRVAVRERVRTILEGGEEAFSRRLGKYGMGARG
jgi:hypothetical protein